jgi:hypothetical protein
MSDERTRDRGNLFENTEKKKPSQPDMQGNARIGGVDYELRAWRRDDQLTLAVAPPRGDQNTYPPDVLRGALDPGPTTTPSKRGGKSDEAPVPAWQGDIVGDEAAYAVQGFPKQGKSGVYFTLSFSPIAKPPPPPPPVDETPEATGPDDESDVDD